MNSRRSSRAYREAIWRCAPRSRRGEEIAAKIARGSLAIGDAISYALQTARGLAAAHARGIIHRDVKLSNLTGADEDVVKILDFGIAKLAGNAMTAPGFTPGTVSYMSREQTRAEVTYSSTDIWWLGVVLSEMLTGVKPFRGPDAKAVAVAICDEEPESVRARQPMSGTSGAARCAAAGEEGGGPAQKCEGGGGGAGAILPQLNFTRRISAKLARER